MSKPEKIQQAGGHDFNGNAGFIKTRKNTYVFNQYENLPWARQDGIRGVLHFRNESVQFVPVGLFEN